MYRVDIYYTIKTLLDKGYNYYSVPGECVGHQVSVHCNEALVAIYYEDQKLTVHPMAHGERHYITRDEHRPAYKRKNPAKITPAAWLPLAHMQRLMEALE